MFELGKSLREARLRHGLELTHVEARIRVRTKYLRALEWGRFDLLPGGKTGREILRAYAEHLNLDPELYLDEYDARVAARKRPTAKAARGRRLFEADLIALLVPLVPSAAAVAIIFLVGGGSGPDRLVGNPAPPPPASSQRSNGLVHRVEGRRPSPPPSPSRSTRAPLTSLEVTASHGDSWLSIRAGSARGKVLFEGTLAKGQSLRLERERLWVRFGAASNLEVRVNGAPPRASVYGTLDALVTPAGFRKIPLAGGIGTPLVITADNPLP